MQGSERIGGGNKMNARTWSIIEEDDCYVVDDFEVRKSFARLLASFRLGQQI